MVESVPVRSAGNAKLKTARALRDGRDRDHVLLEGRHLLAEALDAGVALQWVLHDPGLDSDAELAPLLRKAAAGGAEVQACEPDLSRAGSDLDAPAGVLACAARPQIEAAPLLADAAAGDWALMLGGVQDPRNVGALVRVAAGLGARALLAAKGGGSPWHPRALRGASGNTFRLPVVERVDPAALLDAARAAGWQIWAADAGGAPPATLAAAARQAPVLLVLGEEGRGVAEDVLAHCDGRVGIPLARGVESLNVATAAAVLAWQLAGVGRDGTGAADAGASETPR